MIENECKCDICVGFCTRNPGWCTPDEAQIIINKGFGNQLMKDWWVAIPNNIFLLCPASIGCENSLAPAPSIIELLWGFDKGRCTFLTENNLCKIHDFKPKECLYTHHSLPMNQELREEIVSMWDTDKGKNIVTEWENDNA